jgi:NADH:ubiquinone oxidoreductase subunit 4 (subunit M)
VNLVSCFGYIFRVGLVGGAISCALCLRQYDLKSFVAYSSVCHMGFGLAGLFCYSYFGLVGGVYMLIAHGFCSSCLFYVLYIFYERFHSRRLFVLKGLGVIVPVMLLVWFIFSVLNIGVPPFFSFFSEVLILIGVGGLSIFSMFVSGLFLFGAGVYGIFFYVVSCHGRSFLEGVYYGLRLRELLNVYGHFLPLFYFTFYVGLFFY